MNIFNSDRTIHKIILNHFTNYEKAINYFVVFHFYGFVFSCGEKARNLEPQSNSMPVSQPNARYGDSSLLVDETIIDDYEVRKGIIHFKDLSTYNELMKNNQLFLSDLKRKKVDFVSFRDKAVEAIQKAEAANNIEERIKIISENEILIYQRGNAVYETMPGFIAHLINPDGFVVIGKVYYRHTPDFQYIIFGNNDKWLEDAKNGKFDGKHILRFNLHSSSKNGRLSVWGCTWLGGVTNNSTGLRRVEANLWVEAHHHYTNQGDPATGQQIWQIDLWVTSVGYSMYRTRLSSNWWYRYPTSHTLRAHWNVKASLDEILKVDQQRDLVANNCSNCSSNSSHLYIVENHISNPPAIITRSIYALPNFLATTSEVSAGAKPTDCWGNNN